MAVDLVPEHKGADARQLDVTRGDQPGAPALAREDRYPDAGRVNRGQHLGDARIEAVERVRMQRFVAAIELFEALLGLLRGDHGGNELRLGSGQERGQLGLREPTTMRLQNAQVSFGVEAARGDQGVIQVKDHGAERRPHRGDLW